MVCVRSFGVAVSGHELNFFLSFASIIHVLTGVNIFPPGYRWSHFFCRFLSFRTKYITTQTYGSDITLWVRFALRCYYKYVYCFTIGDTFFSFVSQDSYITESAIGNSRVGSQNSRWSVCSLVSSWTRLFFAKFPIWLPAYTNSFFNAVTAKKPRHDVGLHKVHSPS